jgi:hypothetical protein
MSGGGGGRIDPEPTHLRHGHARTAPVASAAGGGWTSPDPTPGGAMGWEGAAGGGR